MISRHYFTASQNNSLKKITSSFHHSKLIENIKIIEHLKIIESITSELNTVESSEYIVLRTFLFSITPLVQVFHQLSSLTIVYLNAGFNSS